MVRIKASKIKYSFWHEQSVGGRLATTLVATIAKLSPSSNSSWAEVAIFPINPATHPPTRPPTPDKYQNKSKQVVGG